MGKSLNMFKSYKILNDEFGDKNIKYECNFEVDFSYSSINKISKYFDKQGIEIPIYDWVEAPEDGVLELINPEEISKAISSILEECDEDIRETFLQLKEFSDKDYYFVWDNE